MKSNIFQRRIIIDETDISSKSRNLHLSNSKSSDDILRVNPRSPEFGKSLAFAYSFARLLESQPLLLAKTTDDLPVIYRMNTRYNDNEKQAKAKQERH